MLSRGPVPRFVLATVLVGVAAVGVLGGLSLDASGPVALGVTGVLAGCVGAGIAREAGRPVTEAAVQAAAWTVGAMLFLFGLAVLLGPPTAVLTAVALAGVAGVVWLLRSGRGDAGRSPSPPTASTMAHPVTMAPTESAPAATLPPVAGMSTRALGREWLMTSAALHTRLDSRVRQAIVRRREETLDELERRDPAGFARWLAAGPDGGSDPAQFVQGGRTAGTDAA